MFVAFCYFIYNAGSTGDDSNPGSQDKPFKTIVKARDTIRAIKNTTGLPSGGFVVTVVPGDYQFIDGPLEFTAEDSGTAKSPIMSLMIYIPEET